MWGPRKTGKSSLLQSRFPDSAWFDFHDTDLFFEATKRPALVRERILALEDRKLSKPIVLDEVQKVPPVLDEVQRLIESHRLSFVLCGSSARKLKRGQANLLGGRAWKYHLHPLTYLELENSKPGFDLLRALNHGLLPAHYLEDNAKRSLQAYTVDYLKEEIMAEGLTRNVPAFSRFLDAAAFCHGEIVNYTNIARDCGVDSKTIREYFLILEDTLIGYQLEPYAHSRRRDILLKAPKFYFFDTGIASSLTKRILTEAKGSEFGKAFEHFILMELIAYRSLAESDFPIRYWRTNSGLEVDFVLGDAEIAIEVKGTTRVDTKDLAGLKAFQETAPTKRSIVVCNEKAARKSGDVEIFPWREFLDKLHAGKIIR